MKNGMARVKEFGEFSRDDTLVIKGFALLMMVWHHLFTLPEYIYEPWRPVYLINLMDSFGCEGILQLLSYCGKICVPIFFFMAGFGQYRSMEIRKGRYDTIGRLKRFYLSYWKVFLIFIPAAFLFFGNQNPYSSCSDIYANYNRFYLFPFVRSFLGIEAVYNKEWWFILPYVVCTAALPVWGTLIKNKSFPIGAAMIIVMAVLFNLGEPFSGSTVWAMTFGQSKYCLSFFLGALMAKDHTLESYIGKWQKLGLDRVVIELPGIILLLLLRLSWCNDDPEMDLIFTPLLIIMIALLFRKSRCLSKAAALYGKNSTNIWLFHTFLCYYFCFCQHLVYLPRYAFIILPAFMIVCLAVSMAIDLFWKAVGAVYRRLFRSGGQHGA